MNLDLRRVHVGRCEKVLRKLAENSVDAVVTDPPYGLGKEPVARAVMKDWLEKGFHEVNGAGFMGKEWDAFVPQPALWVEVFRVMKPGAHLFAFSGTRTYDWMVLGIRLAGFEIRDQVAWVYGSGFPKSLDVSKAIDKLDATEARRERALRFTAWMRSTGITADQINAATSSRMASHYLTDKEQPAVATGDMFDKLRRFLPAVPEWVEEMVRQRTIESENFKARKVVGKKMAIDPSKARLGVPGRDAEGRPLRGTKEIELTKAHTAAAKKWEGWGTALKPAIEPIVLGRKPISERTVAANVLRWGTGALNVEATRIGFASPADESETKEKNRHADFGTEPGGNAVYGDFSMVSRQNYDPSGRWPSNVLLDQYAAGVLDGKEADASRFFYVAKPDCGERNMGLGAEARKRDEGREDGRPGGENPRNRGAKAVANFHPTVKPVDLMAYLIKLVTPRGGVVLDPFLGSGTTAIAAERLGHPWLGVELSPEYAALAEKRIAAEMAQGNLF